MAACVSYVSSSLQATVCYQQYGAESSKGSERNGAFIVGSHSVALPYASQCAIACWLQLGLKQRSTATGRSLLTHIPFYYYFLYLTLIICVPCLYNVMQCFHLCMFSQGFLV